MPADKVVGKVLKARCRKCGDGLVLSDGGGGDARVTDDAGRATNDPPLREEGQRARARARRESELFSGAAMTRGAGIGAEHENASSVQDLKLTGQRNDTSVLFSLGALSREAAELERPSQATGAAEGDGSGLIDIRALSSLRQGKGSPMPTVDDLANLGGGSFGRGPGIFSAPELPDAHEDPGIQAREGKKGLLIAIVLGTAFFTSAVVIAIVVTRPSATPPAKTRSASVDRELAPVTAPTVEPKPPVFLPLTPTATPVALVPPAVAAAPKGPVPNAAKPKPEGPAIATPTASPTAPAPVPASANANANAPLSLDSAMRPPFNRGEAAAALSGVAYASCKKPDGPQGGGHVYVTFEPNGTVSSAVVDQGAFVGTSAGGCIAAKFRGARVPPFSGSAVRVGKSF